MTSSLSKETMYTSLNNFSIYVTSLRRMMYEERDVINLSGLIKSFLSGLIRFSLEVYKYLISCLARIFMETSYNQVMVFYCTR